MIAEAVDPEANIISGMVIDDEMADDMKVTVIATGFDRTGDHRHDDDSHHHYIPRPKVERRPAPREEPQPRRMAREERQPQPRAAEARPAEVRPEREAPRTDRVQRVERAGPVERRPEPAPARDEQTSRQMEQADLYLDDEADVPFYKRALASQRGDDPNGYGPNWSNVDDYDIPTVLRKQMD